MALRPDTFLLIIISSGAFILIVGMIIAISCPLNVLSFSYCYGQCGRLCRRIVTRKNKNKHQNVINYSSGRKLSFIEGRPQGHGFYTSGPWSSTETTSTCLGGQDTYQQASSVAAQTELMSGRYFEMMSGSNSNSNNTGSDNSNNITSETPLSPTMLNPPHINGAQTTTSSSSNISNDFDVPTDCRYVLQGDVEDNNLNMGNMQVLCANCNGAGFINPASYNTYNTFGSNNNNNNSSGNNDSSSNHHNETSPSSHNHIHYIEVGGSSGCLSSGSDSAMASDMDTDTDMMMMCM